MKANIIYSSKTGNTKKIAYEILKVMPEETNIYDIREIEFVPEEELLVLGFWVDRAKPDKEALKFLEKVKGKKIAAFGTMGVYPESPHAQETKENIKAILQENNELLGSFLCQGKIDPAITEMFMGAGGQDKIKEIHKMTPERIQMHKESSNHPDEADCINARAFMQNILKEIQRF